MKKRKMCMVFRCAIRKGYYCCADCRLVGTCHEKCLNSPDKCGNEFEDNQYFKEKTKVKNLTSKITEEKLRKVSDVRTKEEVGELVKKYVAKKQVPPSDFEAVLGITHSAVNSLFGRTYVSDCIRLAKICAFLEISMDELMGLK